MHLSPTVEKLVTKIANEHCSKPFGYLTKDDLINEIWNICLNALPEYDSELGPLENFLRKTVKNRLINRFKELTKSIRQPCPRCIHFDPGKSPSDCAKYGDNRQQCEKWRNYQLSVNSRNSLLNAAEAQFERPLNDDAAIKMMSNEIVEIIERKIPKEFLNDFYQLKDCRLLPKQKMKHLMEEIHKILVEENLINED